MAEYLAEVYMSRATAAAPPIERFSQLADELSSGDSLVRLVLSIFVPEEEMCFYLFEAESADAVREVTVGSGLQLERLVEAVSREG
jgi:hypothetical protein